jgi:hypothetical protein
VKPTFILVNEGNRKLAINSQDLKTLILKDGQATITTSTSEVRIPCSDYMADRIKKEMRERYNFVNITPTGSRNQDNRKNNAVLCLQNEEQTVLIFPKAIKFLDITDTKVKAFVVHPKSQNKSFEVRLNSPLRIDFQGLLGAVQKPKRDVAFA